MRKLIVAALLCTQTVAHAARRIPDDNLGYPVLVTLPNGTTASACFFATDHNVFLVTAAHVLVTPDGKAVISNTLQTLSYGEQATDATPTILDLDLAKLAAGGEIRTDVGHDVTVVRVMRIAGRAEKYDLKPVEGTVIRSTSPAGILFAQLGKTTKQYADVLISNDVIVFGYPRSLGLKEVPQLDYTRPLLRKGIVAGKNDGQKTIIIDAPVYPGNSGGPVLELEQENVTQTNYKIIGIVLQFVPAAETWLNTTHGYSNVSIGNSGYSVVASMDSIASTIGALEALHPPSK